MMNRQQQKQCYVTYEAGTYEVIELSLGTLALRTSHNALKQLRPRGDM